VITAPVEDSKKSDVLQKKLQLRLSCTKKTDSDLNKSLLSSPKGGTHLFAKHFQKKRFPSLCTRIRPALQNLMKKFDWLSKKLLSITQVQYIKHQDGSGTLNTLTGMSPSLF